MRIHIKSKPGLYTVEAFGRNTITLSTKHNLFQVPTSDFKAFAGGLHNYSVTKQEQDMFLSVVSPDTYKIQLDLDNQIIAMAGKLDQVIAEKAILESYVPLQDREVIEEETDDDQNQYLEEQHQAWLREYEQEKANRTVIEWESMLSQKDSDLEKLNTKLRDIARRVYSQNLDFSKFQMHKGIKFIIQRDHYDDNKTRLCWDPYGFVSNGHSDISSIYRESDWGTSSGGWIKIIDDNVILYYKSGDYGVYEDAIAIECAKKLFPGKNVYSFAGREWDDELTDMFEELPF
jgi:hypothetical protein